MQQAAAQFLGPLLPVREEGAAEFGLARLDDGDVVAKGLHFC
jgi:hypothetical protein